MITCWVIIFIRLISYEAYSCTVFMFIFYQPTHFSLFAFFLASKWKQKVHQNYGCLKLFDKTSENGREAKIEKDGTFQNE